MCLMKVFDSLAYIYLLVNSDFSGKCSFHVLLFHCYLLEDKKFLLEKEFKFKKNIILMYFTTFIKLPEGIHWPKCLPLKAHEQLRLLVQRQHI